MDNLLETHIPYNSNVERMGIHRAPLGDFAANSHSAYCYQDLWADIKKQLPSKY
jgi:hypothetical protein